VETFERVYPFELLILTDNLSQTFKVLSPGELMIRRRGPSRTCAGSAEVALVVLMRLARSRDRLLHLILAVSSPRAVRVPRAAVADTDRPEFLLCRTW
jgi:hypothetical protein